MKQINSDKLYTVNRKRKRNFLKAAALFVIGAFLFNPGFFTDFARAEAGCFLRVPAAAEKNYLNELKVSLDGDSSLSVAELISKLGRALPGYDEEKADYTEVYEIIEELGKRDGVEIMLFAGPEVNKNDFLKVERKVKQKGVKVTYHYSQQENWQNLEVLIAQQTKIPLLNHEIFSLSLLLENINQHVKKGLALVVIQYVEDEYLKISVMDNGKFINKRGEKVSIEEAIRWENSPGWGQAGMGLSIVVAGADLSMIEKSLESGIILPDKRKEKLGNSIFSSRGDALNPTIKWKIKNNNRKSGTSITVYFYRGNDDIDEWREKLIAESIAYLEKESGVIRKPGENEIGEIISAQYPDASEKHIKLVGEIAKNKGLIGREDILKAYKKIRGQTGAIMLVGKKPEKLAKNAEVQMARNFLNDNLVIYFNTICDLVNPKRAAGKKALYFGSAGDFITALSATDADRIIMVDKFPFGTEGDIKPLHPEKKKEYLVAKGQIGWSSEAMLGDIGFLRAFFEWEFEKMGMEKNRDYIIEDTDNPRVHKISLKNWNGKPREILVASETDVFNTNRYPRVLKNLMKEKVDFLIDKAFFSKDVVDKIDEVALLFLKPGSFRITDSPVAGDCFKALLIGGKRRDIRAFEKNSNLSFGWDGINIYIMNVKLGQKIARLREGFPYTKIGFYKEKGKCRILPEEAIVIHYRLFLKDPRLILAMSKARQQLGRKVKFVLALDEKIDKEDFYQTIRNKTENLLDLESQIDLVMPTSSIPKEAKKILQKLLEDFFNQHLFLDSIKILGPTDWAKDYVDFSLKGEKYRLRDVAISICDLGRDNEVPQGDLALLAVFGDLLDDEALSLHPELENLACQWEEQLEKGIKTFNIESEAGKKAWKEYEKAMMSRFN